ncbi:heavy metal translocating P-type ATPase [Rheinheimera tilapiae]|uniref:Heavy metal translocating P-type ATPase n=1 Tax=Rheinheimera tilapiae TaxID=875043 RepID=A0ABV6BD05_9GAMM
MLQQRCFHCHEPVPAGTDFHCEVLAETQVFCCAGCQAVAETIVAQGLSDYYKFRSKAASKANAIPAELQAQLTSYDSAEVLQDLTQQVGDAQRIELSINGMSCAACAWLIERKLQQNSAVQRVSVNSGTARCELVWDAKTAPLSQILSQISELGYQGSPFVADLEEQNFQQELNAYLKRLAVSGIMTMQVMMLAFGLYFGEFSGIEAQYEGYLRWVSLLLTLPVMAYAALPFSSSAWRALKARQLNMDVPITLALYYTFIASLYATVFDTGEVYFESVCMFVFLLQLGKFFEFRARKQARDATSNLLKVMPVSATLWDGEQGIATSARRLQSGDHILVKAGETIPADGLVESGISSADESMLTGEYKAVSKQAGDLVLAGSMNHDGILVVQVRSALTESRLGQIIALQQQTLHQKPAILEKTDRIARFFVQRLLVIATVTFCAWYFWIDADRAFWVTLSVLVATCPCALSLATPTAVTCALAQLNRKGILIKNQHVLDVLPKLSKIFFDKTGTLTQGRFSLTDLQIFTPLYDKAQLLNLMANLEQQSEHPIARAFSPFFQQALPLENVSLSVGAGLSGVYQQQKLRIGRPDFCGLDPQDPRLAGAQVCLSINGELAATVQLADQLRPEVSTLIPALLQRQLKLAILTGDASAAAPAVATQLGINELWQGCSPEQKVSAIQLSVQAGETVLMVGDGINDSPCFHAAHVSVALDSGTELSKNQADVVLLHNDLQQLQTLIDGARQAHRVVRQNLWWAAGYNLVIIPLAVCGFVSPYVAVIGMSCSSLLVVSNSLRLLKS